MKRLRYIMLLAGLMSASDIEVLRKLRVMRWA